jgi:hypothetical protein
MRVGFLGKERGEQRIDLTAMPGAQTGVRAKQALKTETSSCHLSWKMPRIAHKDIIPVRRKMFLVCNNQERGYVILCLNGALDCRV